MQRRGHPAGEAERLAKLQSYGILDTEAEQAFDEIVRLAAFVCGTPISAVSLIDSDRQWFKASVGLEVSETARDVALCDHAIKGRETMIVADAHDDERFRGNPLVASAAIRFYAGTPLITPDGHALGALCVVDRRPRTLTPGQKEALESLGRQCVQLLELRLANRQLNQALATREAAMTALRDSEARINAVAESALDALVAADELGVIVGWNAAAERIFGYPRAEILGQPLTTIMPERYRVAHAKGMARMVATRESRLAGKTVELQGLRKDGSVFDLEMSLGSWGSDDKLFFSAILRDVTEPRRAAAAVREERDFTAAVLDATDALMIVLTRDGSITRFNKACEHASGYRSEEVIGRQFDFLLPPKEADGVLEAFASLSAGQLRGRFENHWMHRNGSERLIAWSNAVIVDEAGDVVHVIGTGIDVTEQRKAETALGRQGAIMCSVLKHMADGVIVTDERGGFVLHNAAADRMLGRGASDGEPSSWPEGYGLFHSDGETRLDLEETPMARALRGEHVEQFEILMRAPTFPLGHWHSVTASPIRDDTGGIIGSISVGRDVTERKQTEQTLANQAVELRELALKDELTGLRNRRGFMVLAEQQLRQSARAMRPALLVFIDLDGMKRINDQFGHDEGDRALRDTAAILRAVFRDSDIVARLGGDEFVVLVPEADEHARVGIWDRLAVALDEHNARVDRPCPLAMSFGSTTHDPQAPRPIEALLASADAVMYAQKEARRASRHHRHVAPVGAT